MGDSSISMPDPRTMSMRIEKPWPLDYRLEQSAHHSRRQPSGGNGQHNSWADAEGAGRAQFQSAAPFLRRPLAQPSIGGFLSMNAARDVAAIVSKLPARLRQDSTTCVPFPHPLSTGTARKLPRIVPLPRMGSEGGIAPMPHKSCLRSTNQAIVKEPAQPAQAVAGPDLNRRICTEEVRHHHPAQPCPSIGDLWIEVDEVVTQVIARNGIQLGLNDAERSQDVFVHIVVKRAVCDTLDNAPGPVQSGPVLPTSAWLEAEG
ncbi:hypothetical protein ACCO45_002640 [Purpureocillium lilacinum]|uniref:Uncharacterized protein n=1 Tax=Purpureocillium lilacinum TaxID=33203 RepID=A0ACC4ECA8_PURLI